MSGPVERPTSAPDLLEFIGGDGFGPLTRPERKLVREILARGPWRPYFVAGRIVQAAAMLGAGALDEETVRAAERLTQALNEVCVEREASRLIVLLALPALLLEIGMGPESDGPEPARGESAS